MKKISIGQPSVGLEEADAAHRVIMSGMLIQGAEVAAAEDAFCEYTGIKNSIAVANGTLALELALRAHGISQGDEVITTPFSFFATGASILNSGATPVFVDIDPATYNIDPQAIEAAITSKTAAIMPVHLYGRPCDMDAITKIAGKHSLAIIEDAAQAAGSWFNGRHAGGFGTGSFSFYGAKNITSGEGGMLTTNDSQFAERLRKLRNHGSSVQYVHDDVSSNYRMTDIQGAILGVQLQKLEKITIRRQENAAFYNSAISSPNISLPLGNDDTYQSCIHQYTIRVHSGRDQLQVGLAAQQIDARAFYPLPIHKQPALASMSNVSLPVAEAAATQVLALPVHPGLSNSDLERVATAVNSLAKALAE